MRAAKGPRWQRAREFTSASISWRPSSSLHSHSLTRVSISGNQLYEASCLPSVDSRSASHTLVARGSGWLRTPAFLRSCSAWRVCSFSFFFSLINITGIWAIYFVLLIWLYTDYYPPPPPEYIRSIRVYRKTSTRSPAYRSVGQKPTYHIL